MPERVIVTGGDAAYFPLLDELCASVRSFRTADELGLAVINAGLEPEQTAHFADHYGARILELDWDIKLPALKVRGREHLKVQIARAFLDIHVPDAELIAWVDGDAWVQDIAAIDMAFEAAARGPLAIVSQTTRYATHAVHVKWGLFGYAQIRTILYKNARRAGLPEKLARAIGDRPVLNSGFFALRRDAPLWAAWRARQVEVLKRGRIFTSDQLSLALAVYMDGHPIELLPDICNYMGPWACNADGTVLVERYTPYQPVGVVHMAGENAMRRDLAITTPIRTPDGAMVERSLRRPAWVK